VKINDVVQTMTGRRGTIVRIEQSPDESESARVHVRMSVRPGRRPVAIVCRYHPDDVTEVRQ
jgi:hypothetical protein